MRPLCYPMARPPPGLPSSASPLLPLCCSPPPVVQVLTSFASGRATSLVLDSGASGTTVAAVHDGLLLHKVRPGPPAAATPRPCAPLLSTRPPPLAASLSPLPLPLVSPSASSFVQAVLRSPLGGDLLTRALQRLLQEQGVQVSPRPPPQGSRAEMATPALRVGRPPASAACCVPAARLGPLRPHWAAPPLLLTPFLVSLLQLRPRFSFKRQQVRPGEWEVRGRPPSPLPGALMPAVSGCAALSSLLSACVRACCCAG
jgi:hypothetical protein